MSTVKCSNCGKFTSATDGVKCTKCAGVFDRGCAKLSKGERTPPNWSCLECKGNKTRDSPLSDTIISELQLLRTELANQMGAIREDMACFSTRIDKLFESVHNLGDRLDNVESRISVLENKSELSPSQDCNSNQDLLSSISQLKTELNDRDQELLLTDIEISGIPDNEGENLSHLVTLIASKLSVVVHEDDIVSVQRAKAYSRNRSNGSGPKPSSRSIYVRFTRRSIRDNLLKSARVRRDADTSGLNLPGDPRRFYLNERLTRHNKHLFYKAREEKKRLSWQYLWTKDGNIFARQKSDTKVKRIRTEADLAVVFGGPEN
ncbi:unnamed protein product [Leptosia nina]|uniref:FP protein C-terminal domain-containing protein n=1 Tax=Leptosia nina TaxID=320188 RepID=A0AAV1IZL7_9NEOP